MAVELEWNNKDPFFDRDLNNFRLLFDLRAIDVGVILTRATELQAVFDRLGKGSSYGASTTHHEKLWPRIEGGGGGGCPVLTFAITPALYVDDGDDGAGGGAGGEGGRRAGCGRAGAARPRRRRADPAAGDPSPARGRRARESGRARASGRKPVAAGGTPAGRCAEAWSAGGYSAASEPEL